MNLEQLVIDRYTKNKKIEEGYYLRIRKKDNYNEIKVYYDGIKIFEVIDGKIYINTAIFIPNTKNVFEKNKLIEKYKNIPQAVSDDIDVIDKYFNFYIGSKASLEKLKGYKINLDFADAGSKCSEDELEQLVNDLKLELKTYNNIFKAVELGKKDKKKQEKRTRILLYTQDELNEKGNLIKKSFKLASLYPLTLSLLNGTLCTWLNDKGDRLFKIADLAITSELKSNVELDLEEIEPVLENRVKTYIGKSNSINDYKNTKSLNNQEKQYQQKFMVFMNRLNKNDILYKTKENNKEILYKKEICPFEMEYVVYSGKTQYDEEDEKRTSSNIKGRIDNTFVENDTIALVEIKYGTDVIDKTNGIHKHLIDLYSCLNINKEEILTEYENRVKNRNEVLDINKDIHLKHIKYDIVCIYNSNVDEQIQGTKEDKLSRKAVINKIDSIYNYNCYKAGVKVKKCNCKIHGNETCKDINKYCKKLLNEDIPTLIKRLETLGCPVKIILVDDKFENFEEYSFSRKNL